MTQTVAASMFRICPQQPATDRRPAGEDQGPGGLLVRPGLPVRLGDLALDARGGEGPQHRRALPRHEPGRAEREPGHQRGLPQDGWPPRGARCGWRSPPRRPTATRSWRRCTPRWAPGSTARRSRTGRVVIEQSLAELGTAGRTRRAARPPPSTTKRCGPATTPAWTPSATTSARRPSTSTAAPSSAR